MLYANIIVQNYSQIGREVSSVKLAFLPSLSL